MTTPLTSQNGTCVYDKKHDLLVFRIDNRDYKESMEFDEFVIDIDTDGFLAGIRIFDASRVLQLSSAGLQNIRQFSFSAIVDSGVVSVRLRFTAAEPHRRVIEHSHNFVRDAPHQLGDSETICTVM